MWESLLFSPPSTSCSILVFIITKHSWNVLLCLSFKFMSYSKKLFHWHPHMISIQNTEVLASKYWWKETLQKISGNAYICVDLYFCIGIARVGDTQCRCGVTPIQKIWKLKLLLTPINFSFCNKYFASLVIINIEEDTSSHVLKSAILLSAFG